MQTQAFPPPFHGMINTLKVKKTQNQPITPPKKTSNCTLKNRHSKWPIEDEILFLTCIRQFGKDWNLIANQNYKNASNRSYSRCMCHYKWSWGHYSIREIQSIEGPIEIEKYGYYYRILNLAPVIFGPLSLTHCLPSPQDINSWSKEEDINLLEGIRTFGIRWAMIEEKYLFHRRDNKMCEHRYATFWKRYKINHIRLIRGPIEIIDMLNTRVIRNLLAEVEKLAINDLPIQYELVERLCLDLTYNEFPPKKKGLFWTEMEDKQLLEGIRNLGSKWKQISNEYFNQGLVRSRQDCCARYNHCWKKQYSISDIQAFVGIIRVKRSSISQAQLFLENFVIDEKEKPLTYTLSLTSDPVFSNIEEPINKPAQDAQVPDTGLELNDTISNACEDWESFFSYERTSEIFS